MSKEDISPETENEMRGRFFEEVLDDLEKKTEDWQLIIVPLGDSMGYRVEMHLTEGATAMYLTGSSHRSALAAGSMAIARGLARIEAALAEEKEEFATENLDED